MNFTPCFIFGCIIGYILSMATAIILTAIHNRKAKKSPKLG
jgi:hypothetical protein